MRRHGWGGSPPATDEEARRRILEAAERCVDDRGPQASLSDVAAEVGVTRQTVYRYYPSTDELFSVLAQRSADDFIGRIADRMALHDDPVDALVEGLAFGIASVPGERYLALLLRSGDAFTRGIISPVAMDFGRSMLDRSPVDWDALGYDDDERDGLVELMLRLIQSLAVTPTTPLGRPRTDEELRAWLRRWFAPVVRRPLQAGTGATVRSRAGRP